MLEQRRKLCWYPPRGKGDYKDVQEAKRETAGEDRKRKCTLAYIVVAEGVISVCTHGVSCHTSDCIRSPVSASNSVLMSTPEIATFAWSPTSCINPGSHIFNIWVLPFFPTTLILACMHTQLRAPVPALIALIRNSCLLTCLWSAKQSANHPACVCAYDQSVYDESVHDQSVY